MNISKILVALLVSITLLASCEREIDPTPPTPPEPKDTVKRTVIVYMNADNNLYNMTNGGVRYGALVDINEMEQAWDDSFGGALVVYLNAPKYSNNKPTLYLIRHDTDPTKINSTVLKTYDWHDSNDTSVLSSVLNDIRTINPAEYYGLIFWSHGTGWVPKGMNSILGSPQSPSADQNAPVTYSFGTSTSYGGTEMEIDDLAKALPRDVKFDYIAFDACYMGGIEVAYELRKSCNYFIGSAVETPVDGFEYQLIVEDLMSGNVENIVKKTYDHYNSLHGWWATCAMSVVDCDKIEELAASLKTLTQNSPRSLSDIQFNEMQDLGSSRFFRGTYYDFGDFVNTTWAGQEGLAAFNQKMNEVVVVKYNTKWNLADYPIDRYSGFSCFAPKASQTKAIAAFRNRFAWSVASGIGAMN